MKRAFSRRPTCPTCGQKMVPIVYGLPGPELFERAERGEIILGGCMPEPTRWGCAHCRPTQPTDEETEP